MSDIPSKEEMERMSYEQLLELEQRIRDKIDANNLLWKIRDEHLQKAIELVEEKYDSEIKRLENM